MKKSKSWIASNWQTILILSVIVACGVYTYYVYNFWKVDAQRAGQFGDMFGAITAIIGSLTFIFLLYSIKLQREELEVARNEYRLGLEEMQKQTTINETNKETAKLQRFEATYFNALNLFMKSRQGVKGYKDKIQIPFDFIIDQYVKYWTSELIKHSPNYLKQFHKFHNQRFNRDQSEYEKLEMYFRPIVSLIRIIITSRLEPPAQNKMYFEIFTGLLNRTELAALFLYISLSDDVLPAERQFVSWYGTFDAIYKDEFIGNYSFNKLLEGSIEYDKEKNHN